MQKSLKYVFFNLLRLSLGLLFLFSGFVKCVDPVGGAIKIEDYFIAWGFSNVPEGFCLFLSVLQNIVEFTVGFALFVGVHVRLASLFALLFMLFYTPLTLYIALVNPVSDCGCFGDAVKLTNWQTFFKNLIFLPIAFLVFKWSKELKPSVKRWRQTALLACGVTIGVLVSIKGLTDEPMIDFRPFSVGTDVPQAMSVPSNAPLTEYATTFLLEKDGVIKEFDEKNYPYDDSTWVYRETRTVVVKEGYTPSINDFTFIDRDGEDHSEELLHDPEPIFLAISPKLEKSDDCDLTRIANLSDMVRKNGYRFYVCTSSTEDVLLQIQSEFPDSELSFLLADETMLKTIVRSNLSVIVMQRGVISAKYHINHLPDFNTFAAAPTSSYLQSVELSYDWLQMLCLVLVCIIVFMLVYKRKKNK